MGSVPYAAATVLAVVTLTGALTGCGDDSPPRGRDTTPNADAVPVLAEVFASEYGVRIGIRVTFPDDRVLTDARLVWDGGSTEVTPYPLDGTDPDRPPEDLHLPAGTPALLEGTVLAPCPDTPSVLVFTVESSADGSTHVDHFRADGSDRIAHGFAAWCRRPVTLHVSGTSASPDGDYTLTVELSNPGPRSVLLRSEPSRLGRTVWESAQVVAPAGSRTALTIRGHGPPECRATPPWEGDHLRVDGHPIRPADGDWC